MHLQVVFWVVYEVNTLCLIQQSELEHLNAYIYGLESLDVLYRLALPASIPEAGGYGSIPGQDMDFSR